MTMLKQSMTAVAVALSLVFALPAMAQQKKAEKAHSADEIKKDVANHRAMAEAHLNAAKCLESGKPEKDCVAQLTKDCKGLAIGKYCGMKHGH
jgi:hypothetical protein